MLTGMLGLGELLVPLGKVVCVWCELIGGA